MKTHNTNPHVSTTEIIFEEELYDLIMFTQFTRIYENLQQLLLKDHSPSLEIRLENSFLIINKTILSKYSLSNGF